MALRFAFVDSFPEDLWRKSVARNLQEQDYFFPAFDLRTEGDKDFQILGKNLRLAVYDQGKLVAASWGRPLTKNRFMMHISFVEEDYRGNGIYKEMLKRILDKTKEFDEVDSYHHIFNNTVIACKLKAGFRIVGLDMDPAIGTRVRMRYFHNPKLEKLFLDREKAER